MSEENTDWKLEPEFNNVVVKLIAEEEKKTSSGLYIPSTTNEQVVKGVVKAVGPGIINNGVVVPVPYKYGDAVLFDKGLGRVIKSSGPDKVYVIQDVHIYGRIK